MRGNRFAHRLSAHQHRTAAALLGLLVLVYLWPALVGGGVLAPLSLLYAAPPWTGLRPDDLASYFNPGLLDVTLSYYPWDVLARELIHSGTFPAWNPYALGGTPFWANPEVGWLSPFNVPLWVLPLNYALGLAAAVKLWVAGFGAYLLARELRLGFWPGMLAGISFALCAFNVVWLSHSAFTAVSVTLPWLLLLAERIARRGRSLDGLALAGVVAVALAGGHPGTQVHVLAGALLYVLARIAIGDALPWRERLRRLGLVAGALALGALLMAVVLLPAQQAAIDSAGAAARRGGGTEEFNGAHMPFDVLRTVLFPEWWGRPSEVIGGPSVYNERTFYAGTLALVLAAVGLLAAWRTAWRRMLPFALLGALGTAVALEAPGLHALVVHLPPFDRVQNQRIALWLQLAIPLLGAFGLQAMLGGERGARRIAWGAIAAALLAALLAVASIDLGGDTLSRAVGYALRRKPPISADAAALASVLWPVALVCGLAIAHAALRTPHRLRLLGGVVVLLVAIDLLHAAHGYQSMAPASKAVPPRTSAIAFLERKHGEGRIAGFDFAVANDWSTVYRLRDARGYDAPQPSVRFHRLWRAAVEPEQRLHNTYTFGSLDATGAKVLALLGTRWIAAAPGTNLRVPGLRTAYDGDDARIFENTRAVSRAFAAARVDVAGDEDAELAATLAEDFDPRTDVVVRRDELGGTPPAAGAAPGTVRVVAEANSRVALRATLSRRSIVVLDDAWARGWRVTVDGRPARALQADMVLRGVVVPAGTHEIVWSYRVPGLRTGALLSALGLLIAAGWAGWLLVRRRRDRQRRFPLADDARG